MTLKRRGAGKALGGIQSTAACHSPSPTAWVRQIFIDTSVDVHTLRVMNFLPEKKVTAPDSLPFFLITLVLVILVSGCEPGKPLGIPSEEEIGRSISTILELPTYEYVYRDVIYIADQASFLGIRHRDTQLLFAVDVKIQAGINLQRGFSVEPVSQGGLHITLPAPEILIVDADEATIHQYFKKEFGGEINRLDYYDEISNSKERITEDALKRGILDRAGGNAETLVRSVLSSLVAGEVRVSFSGSFGQGGKK